MPPSAPLLTPDGKPIAAQCRKLRDRVRKQLIGESRLASPTATEILASSAAEMVVTMRLLGEKQAHGIAPTDEIRTLPGLAGNIKRTLAELGVMDPIEEVEGDL